MLIMFDYGHGGKDPGAINGQRKESNDVLKLGKLVTSLVRAAGIQVDETRTTDKALTLTDRSNMERKKSTIISFHSIETQRPIQVQMVLKHSYLPLTTVSPCHLQQRFKRLWLGLVLEIVA